MLLRKREHLVELLLWNGLVRFHVSTDTQYSSNDERRSDRCLRMTYRLLVVFNLLSLMPRFR